MKTFQKLLIATLVIAAYSQVSDAKFVWGACPTNVQSVNYDASMALSRNHRLFGISSFIDWILKVINNYPKCFNFGNYGYTTQQFNDRHVTAVSPIATKLLYWDASSGAELHFLCVNKARFNSLLSWATTTYNLTVPGWMSSILNVVSGFLDWFHLELSFVFANNVGAFPQKVINDMAALSRTSVTRVYYDDIVRVDNSKC